MSKLRHHSHTLRHHSLDRFLSLAPCRHHEHYFIDVQMKQYECIVLGDPLNDEVEDLIHSHEFTNMITPHGEREFKCTAQVRYAVSSTQ